MRSPAGLRRQSAPPALQCAAVSEETVLPDLLAYVEFSVADGVRLSAMLPLLAPHFPRFADHFYQRVLADAGARAIFQDDAQVERQKG